MLLFVPGLVTPPAHAALQEAQCNYYLPLVEGTGIAYEHFDRRDRLEYRQEIRIVSVASKEGEVHATMETKHFDRRNRLQHEGTFGIICHGDVLQLDLQSLMDQAMLEAYEGMEMVFEGGEMMIPSELSVGQSLPDATLDISVRSSGMQVAEMTMQITDRQVTARENITVPAGTFEAYRIVYNTHIEMRAMGIPIRTNTQTVEYHAREVGVVRTEIYDQRERLQSYQVLSEIF